MRISRFSAAIESALIQQRDRPRVLESLVSPAEIAWLQEEMLRGERVEKHSGIVNYKYPKGGEVEAWIEAKVAPFFGPMSRHGGVFFDTPISFHVHTDTGKEEEMAGRLYPYKNILVPLVSSAPSRPLYTVFFEQRNPGQAAHFWNADEFSERTPVYNFKVTDYGDLIDKKSGPLDPQERDLHLSHLPPSCLEGLSILEVVHWKTGDIIAFDCNMLHASNDFQRFAGRKTGLSYFGSKELRV